MRRPFAFTLTATALCLTVSSLAAMTGPATAEAPPPAPVAAAPAAPAAAPADDSARTTVFERRHGYPTPRTVGVPRGWKPKRTVRGDVTIERNGAVVEDLRIINGTLDIQAFNVTVRRVEILGGTLQNFRGGTCHSGLKVRATTLRRSPGQVTEGDFPVVSDGGYSARRVEILGLSEGFRVGGSGECGPVKIVNSYARIKSPDSCGDWHGDGVQGWQGGHLIMRNSTLKLIERNDCGGTAPFFYPGDQGNTSVDIDGLIVEGGGYSFRLGTPGSVRNLHIAKGYYYGPIEVQCSALSAWGADIVTLKGGQPKFVRNQRCNTSD